MASNEIHIADVGTIFEVTIMDGISVVDISSATSMEIIFEKQDRTKVINNAVFTTDGIDGKMQYKVTLSSELDSKGNWKIQGKVTLPTGTWSTDINRFKVYENL